jgi:hypothetical protein
MTQGKSRFGLVRTIVLFATLAGGLTTSAIAQVGKPSDPALLDPNLAKAEELQKIPHLTPELVTKLIEKRPFLRTGDFDEFLVEQRLTPDQRTNVYGRMFLHINLNKATSVVVG